MPVTLYSGEQRNDIRLHLVDSESGRRVRYQRVDEETGEEVPWEQIVRGYEYDGKGYVLLSKEEMEQAGAELTKQIEIEDFVDGAEIGSEYFDKPYLLEPGKGGSKPYVLLRETLRQSGKVGIARVVIRSKEHLAALMVKGDLLMLELLRFPQELRDTDFLEIPQAESVKMQKREIDLALQLVESMTSDWKPERYEDQHRARLMRYVEEKIERGELSAGKPSEPEKETEEEGTVVDLMDYLKQSIEQSGKKAPAKSAKKTARKASKRAKKTPQKTSTTRKSA